MENKFLVSTEDVGKRLDEVLFAHGAALSRTKCASLIKEKIGRAHV